MISNFILHCGPIEAFSRAASRHDTNKQIGDLTLGLPFKGRAFMRLYSLNLSLLATWVLIDNSEPSIVWLNGSNPLVSFLSYSEVWFPKHARKTE